MKRILIVDDDREISTAVRDLLVPEGFAVDTPAEPRTALVETIREVPDLVILDVNMPGMTGWEFCAMRTSARSKPKLMRRRHRCASRNIINTTSTSAKLQKCGGGEV